MPGSSTFLPSTSSPREVHASCNDGRPASFFASRAPLANEPSARSQATLAGTSDASKETAPSTPSSISAAASTREGRHSMRQGAELFDQCPEFGIVGAFVSKDPAPEPIVFAIQQP